MPDINIARLTIQLTQEGNTMGTTTTHETLDIELEYQLPGEEPFVVIRTEGWSLDTPEELSSIVQKVVDSEKNLIKKIKE